MVHVRLPCVRVLIAVCHGFWVAAQQELLVLYPPDYACTCRGHLLLRAVLVRLAHLQGSSAACRLLALPARNAALPPALAGPCFAFRVRSALLAAAGGTLQLITTTARFSAAFSPFCTLYLPLACRLLLLVYCVPLLHCALARRAGAYWFRSAAYRAPRVARTCAPAPPAAPRVPAVVGSASIRCIACAAHGFYNIISFVSSIFWDDYRAG